jgi:hypothetical protein
VSRHRPLATAAIAALATLSCANGVVRPSDPRIAVMGRIDRSNPDRPRVGYPGVTWRVRIESPSLAIRVASTTATSRLAVMIDGGPPNVLRLVKGESRLVLAGELPPGPHVIEVAHRTETWQGIVAILSFELPPGGRVLPPDPWPQRRLLFIGDSVTCGEATDRPANCDPARAGTDAAATSNGLASYGMLLGRALGAQVHLVCFGGRGLIRDWRGKQNVLNGPQLFEAALPIDGRPAPWNHAEYQPDAIVISLGTNDFNLALGPFPERERYVSAYVAFVQTILARHPSAHVLLTEGAIVNDEKDPTRPQKSTLRAYLAEVVRRIGNPHVRAVESRHYGGDACNEHPTAAQHAQMARDLEPALRQALSTR